MNSVEESENEARENLQVGNFLTAKREYEKILSQKRIALDDKIYFEEKINFATQKYEDSLKVGTGEVFFPVYYYEKKLAKLCKVKIRCENSSGKTDDFKNVEGAVEKSLDKIIKDNYADTVYVFDWGLNDYQIDIVDLNGNKIEPDKLSGKSFELAAAVALFSYIFEITVPPQWIFTGIVNEDGNLLNVEYIKEKFQICLAEREEDLKFFIPLQGSNNDKQVESKGISDIFSNYFIPRLNIEEQKYKLGKIRITLDIHKIKTTDNFEHIVAKFDFKNDYKNNNNDIIAPEEGKIIMNKFFVNVISRLSDSKGVIIDGLRPNYLNARIGSLLKENKISNFVAVRSQLVSDIKSGKSFATVFVVTEKNTPTRMVGDAFEYYLKKL